MSKEGADTLLVQLDEAGILTVTLNRPESRNAIDTVTQREMLRAFQDASRNPAVRVVIMRGAGQSFSSGGDVRSLGAPDPDDPIAQQWSSDPVWNDLESRGDRLRRFMEASFLLHRMGKPTIAMVRGPAVGMGLSLALACDFRVASDTAFFMTGFARIGMCGDFGGSYFMTKLLGPSRTMELFMLNERVSAEEASRLGLVNRLVPDAELEARTLEFARHLARGPAVAQRYIKENVHAALDQTFEQYLDVEARNNVRCRLTQDCKEAVSALAEKREPRFVGR
ncbi:MAG: enoyl-CoA hydratase [Sinobacteraceae bacterium]|nr:enoyl-CoA hydratase [Nevskiaceae bacterium]